MNTLPATLAPVKPATLALFAARLDRYRRAPKGGCTVQGRAFKGGMFIGNLAIDAEPVAPEPAPVVVAIHGFTYAVEGVAVPAEIGTHAFAMTKREANMTYFLVRDNFGEITCDCGSFVFRQAGTGRPCKHGRKLIEMGLMPSPSKRPAPLPSPAPVTAPRRPRRFEPSAEDSRLAAAMFA